jgi:hypothetical protein
VQHLGLERRADIEGLAHAGELDNGFFSHG